jgi:ParB-like chromosome segregation protein Spo0J
MTNLVSLKKIAEDKSQTAIGIKKVTDYMLDPRNVEIEPGFNARDMVNLSPRTRAHIDGMKAAIRAGETMPPLDVRIATDKIYVVEGHCRLTAYMELIGEGLEILLVPVRQYNGSDEDRDFHVLASASQLHLTRLEQGRIYKRRVAFGWSVAQIAERARKSPSYVEQNLMLANANADVRRLLEDDKVSAKVALDALRRHGEQAGAVLTAKLAGAKNGKLTGASVSKAPPPKVTRRIVSSVESFVAALPKNSTAFSLDKTPDDQIIVIPVTAGALRALLAAHADLTPAADELQREAA